MYTNSCNSIIIIILRQSKCTFIMMNFKSPIFQVQTYSCKQHELNIVVQIQTQLGFSLLLDQQIWVFGSTWKEGIQIQCNTIPDWDLRSESSVLTRHESQNGPLYLHRHRIPIAWLGAHCIGLREVPERIRVFPKKKRKMKWQDVLLILIMNMTTIYICTICFEYRNILPANKWKIKTCL